MCVSQDEFGVVWFDVYLISLLWCFVIVFGLFGGEVVIGVVMLSIDWVGCYFLLIVVCLLLVNVDFGGLVGGDDGWFEQVESLLFFIFELEVEVEVFEQVVVQFLVLFCGLCIE